MRSIKGLVPCIFGTISANVSAPSDLTDSLMKEDTKSPTSEACFHVATEAHEISVEHLNCI